MRILLALPLRSTRALSSLWSPAVALPHLIRNDSSVRVARPPNARRSLPVAVLITVVPVAISISYAAIITTESYFNVEDISTEQRSRSSDGGLPPIFQVVSMGAVITFGCVVHFLFVLRHRRGLALDGALRLGCANDANGLSSLPTPVLSHAHQPNGEHRTHGGDAQLHKGKTSDDDELQECLAHSACISEGTPGAMQTIDAAPRRTSAVRVKATRNARSTGGSGDYASSSVDAACTSDVAGTGQSPVEAAARLVSSALSCGRSKGDYQQVATR